MSRPEKRPGVRYSEKKGDENVAEKTFMEIWNEAYDTLCEKGKEACWRYLETEIDIGNIDLSDARRINTDVIETYNL